MYRQAAVLNHGPALYKLGELYETGRLVEKDAGSALKYYRLAAEKDVPEAKEKLKTLEMK